MQSYDLLGVHGVDVNGNGCELESEGNVGVWPGAPIAGGTFDYSLGSPTEFDFSGYFPGAQSASGTFMFDDPPIGTSTGCSTGTVSWTATTTAPPPVAGCQAQDGKLSGRGSTTQTWLQYAYMGAFTSDVCGTVAAELNADSAGNTLLAADNDVSDPLSAIYALPNGLVYGRNWMAAYNDASAQQSGATGSSAGEAAIACRAEAFAGTDIPVTANQLGLIDGALPTAGANPVSATYIDEACAPGGLAPPFTPLALAYNTASGGPSNAYPNPGDQTTSKGAMLFPIATSSVAIFANLPTACVGAMPRTSLATADLQNIWGGTFTNWDQTSVGSGIAACNVAITRVVREDNSGTTQAVDNYLADASGYSTATCDSNANDFATTFGEMQDNQANGTANGDAYWPGGIPATIQSGGTSMVSGCSPVASPTTPGGPALLALAEGVNGAIGYADYSDTIHDANHFASSTSGDEIVTFGLTASDGTIGVAPSNGSQANCNTTAALPAGGTSGAVGLGGSWDLKAQNGSTKPGVDDITWTKEGSTYPICALTWDLVWAGEDGTSPPKPTSTSAEAGTTGTPSVNEVAVSSLAGLPDRGTFEVDAGSAATTTNDSSPLVTSTTALTLPVTSLELSSTVGLPSSGSVTLAGGSATTSAGGSLPVSTLGLASLNGAPATGGTFTLVDSASDSPETLSYSGVGSTTTACGVRAPCLTGVSGGTSGATFASGAAVAFPSTTLTYNAISGSTLTGVTGGAAGTTFLAQAWPVTVPQANEFSYTGLGTGTGATTGTAPLGAGTAGVGCTVVASPCLTGVASSDDASVPSGAALIFSRGTGGPEANLTADQRHTLYAYFTYILSPEGQSKAAVAGYAALPASWLATVLAGFHSNY